MELKEEVHFITVQKGYKKNGDIIPKITLQGEWLERFDFKPGDKLKVVINNKGKIQIGNYKDDMYGFSKYEWGVNDDGYIEIIETYK